MPKEAKHSSTGQHREEVTGTFVGYARDGSEIFRKEEWRDGVDQVSHGLSIGLGATQIIDPKSGEILHQWNPWDVLPKRPK